LLKLKKVVVIGPESTGKSTLSEALATMLNTHFVPEYARRYINDLNRPYTEDDLLEIAKGQMKTEDEAAAISENLLICDTDLNVIKVWSEHKYGNCNKWILEEIARRNYDLYLLTAIDIPWLDDPQREHPEPAMREYFYKIYLDIVEQSGIKWIDIKGSHAERLQTALKAIKTLL